MVTTQDEAAVGIIVNVEGVLNYDYDLGSGYLYPVIIKDARLSKEIIVDQKKAGNPD